MTIQGDRVVPSINYALSIRQPWAWAILYLGKRVENRTWHTNFRGRIYIHAGKKLDEDGFDELQIDIQRVPKILRQPCHLGALVGTARITDCVPPEAVPIRLQAWAVGPWCFMLDDVEPLPKPIPCRGALGFFKPAIGVLA